MEPEEHFEEPAEALAGSSQIARIEQPREGTLAWLAQQPTVELHGLTLPACHRVPAEATLHLGDDDGRCRVTHPDGQRCKAPRTQRYGLCMPHAGGGARDHAAIGALGAATRTRLRLHRQVLGIGTNRAADPRQIARLRAHERAEQLAEALVDAPLDDASLGTLERQTAVLRALDATFPLAQATVELELPTSPSEVAGLGWQELQQLAAQLAPEQAATTLQPLTESQS